MERQAGTFTLQMSIRLAPAHRRRLEYAVRASRIAPADYVSAAIAGATPRLPDEGAAAQRTDAIPLRIYLQPGQRDVLERFCHEHEISVGACISELLADTLADLPDPPAAAQPRPDHSALVRSYRREARRLHGLIEREGRGPSWLTHYLADLEAEIARLERAG